MESKFLRYKNKNIHYGVFGQGRPVLLLHGLPADSNLWNDIAGSLQNNFLVITPDIPGSGQSEILEGENISIEDYADVIKAILDEENIRLCTIIGHSMGGYITLAFAEKHPELLNGFGLFHSTAFADDEDKKQTRHKAIEFIKANGAYAFLKTSTPNLFVGNQHPEEMKKLIEEGKTFDPNALIQYYHAMINRPDRTSVLKTFIKPVLFIIGEKDNVIPLQASLQQCHLPGVSHIYILETGHMGMIEEKGQSELIIRTYLENI